MAGDIGHVIALDCWDQPNHLASRRCPAFRTFPGGRFTSTTATFIWPVVIDHDCQALDAGEDREGGDVACAEYGPCGPVPTRGHHAGEGGFDALADEQAGCDVGMVGELDGAILGGAELSLIKLPEGPLIFHRALTGPI